MSKNLNKILQHGDFKQKRRINSRSKGNRFERKIAKLLNERFETKEFCRTPGSGAFGTTHTSLPTHIKVHGDLITPEKFRFVVECKSGYKVELDDLFKKDSQFWKFIAQAKRDSETANKPWILIYEKTRRKAIVVTEEKIRLKNRVTLPGNCYMYTLEEFLKLPIDRFYEGV